jgi:hypothetical protein
LPAVSENQVLVVVMGSGVLLLLVGVLLVVVGAPGYAGVALIAIGCLNTLGGWKVTHAIQGLRSPGGARRALRGGLRTLVMLPVHIVLACCVGVLFVWLFTPTRTADEPAVSPPPEPFLFAIGVLAWFGAVLAIRHVRKRRKRRSMSS